MALNADDLALLSRKTGLRGWSALRAAGLVTLARQDFGTARLWRPILRFRSVPLRQCPFLVNDVGDDGRYRGLCSLHPEFKPLVCRLSPLTRTIEDTPDGWRESWSFVAPVEGCPGMGRGRARVVQPPRELKKRLDREVEWVRTWVIHSEQLAERDSAETFWASNRAMF